MKADFSINQDTLVRCSMKSWPELKTTVGTLLFSYGTLPDLNAAYNLALGTAILSAEQTFQKAMDGAVSANGGSLCDRFAVAIRMAIQDINDRLHQAKTLLGQGVYLGGAVVVAIDDEYIATVFGGGAYYLWDGTALYFLGGNHDPNALIPDALGSCSKWNGPIYRDSLQPNAKLLVCTHTLANAEACAHILAENAQSTCGDIASAIRQTFFAYDMTGDGTGVLILDHSQEGV